MTEAARGRPRRILQPAEVWVFLGMTVLAAAIAAIYWFMSYEAAGSVLLAGFALACGLIGVRLATVTRSATALDRGSSGGLALQRFPDHERPFLDEMGRIPSPTFAPFALGVGIGLAATALVFGPAPLVVAVVPITWGAADWLRRASAELAATALDDGLPEAAMVDELVLEAPVEHDRMKDPQREPSQGPAAPGDGRGLVDRSA